MKQTMLVADGDAELCDVYRRFSRDRGYEVETTSDGLDCVRKLPGDAGCARAGSGASLGWR